MNFLKNHYTNLIIYNYIIKFHLKNIFQIPKFNKIFLNIGLKNLNTEKKKIIPVILLLKIITNQDVFLTKSKKNIIVFKIKKGSITGCKITLQNKNLYIFLEKLIIFLFLNEKKKININNIKKNNILNFKIKNFLNFFELKKEFFKFQNISNIDISLHTTCKQKNQFLFLLNQIFLIK